jgi:CheY-like chemotaxis protein
MVEQVGHDLFQRPLAVDFTRRVFPHVVLIDIRMPVLDGLEATRLICSAPTLERIRVLVLTTFDLDGYVYAALRAGASGFPVGLAWSDQSAFVGECDESDAVVAVELAQDVADVALCGQGADAEPAGDLGVAETPSEEQQDVVFSVGQFG